MSCKCVEIEKAIGSLESAKSELASYDSEVNLYKMDTDMVCMAVGTSIYYTYCADVQAGLRRKHELFGPVRTGLGRKIDAKVSELLAELEELKEEDRSYHAEEAKKQPGERNIGRNGIR